MRARFLVLVTGALAMWSGRSSGGPWNVEGTLGVATDYESDPGLRVEDVRSEEHVAALLDVPLRYDSDGVEFTLRPSGRVGNSRGYASLASDYEHVDTAAQFTGDIWQTTLTGAAYRDSSLYFIGGLLNGLGVRRDTVSGSLDSALYVTARSQLELQAGWIETKYDQPPTLSSNLVNYHYISASPDWGYAINERTTFKLIVGAGRYNSLDGLTESKSYNAQLGLVRQLSEIWSLTATAGYSKALNSERFFFGPYYLGTFKSNETGTVYSVNLTRTAERVGLSFVASRTLSPTGLAYLSRLDNVGTNITFTRSEYWDFALSAAWQQAHNPVLNGRQIEIHYLNAQLAANWHWSPLWTLSVTGGRINQEYSPPRTSAASSDVMLSLTRHFLRTEL